MPAYLAPGVHVEEVGFGATIEGVATSTAGFVGPTERGTPAVTRIADWEDYVRAFGGPAAGSFMHDAVRGFFANGGREALVVRTATAGADDLVAGVDRMSDADGVGLLVVPDQAEAGSAVAAAMADRCERRGDRIAVLATPRDAGTLPPPPPDSAFAAAYHPWIVVADSDGGTRAVPRPATSPGSSPGPTWSAASTPRPPACRCSTPRAPPCRCPRGTRRPWLTAASTRS